MALTQSDLDALDRAISSGVKEVRFQDRSEIFQDVGKMLEARTLLYLSLHPPSVAPAVQRQIRLSSSKGF